MKWNLAGLDWMDAIPISKYKSQVQVVVWRDRSRAPKARSSLLIVAWPAQAAAAACAPYPVADTTCCFINGVPDEVCRPYGVLLAAASSHA